jgi:hypothetical protein
MAPPPIKPPPPMPKRSSVRAISASESVDAAWSDRPTPPSKVGEPSMSQPNEGMDVDVPVFLPSGMPTSPPTVDWAWLLNERGVTGYVVEPVEGSDFVSPTEFSASQALHRFVSLGLDLGIEHFSSALTESDDGSRLLWLKTDLGLLILELSPQAAEAAVLRSVEESLQRRMNGLRGNHP